MATYVADVPINLTWRGIELARVSRLGRDSENETILAPGRRVEPIPAGEPFAIPDALADAFEATFGVQRGNANVSESARETGRIAGLRRIDG